MNTVHRQQSLFIFILACFLLSMVAGCTTPIRMQSSVALHAGGASIHIGDLDETGTDTRLGVEAYMAGDNAKAFQIFKPLAEKGDAGAQNNLGHLYLSGAQGAVPQDYAKALKWYGKAADQWHASAHFSIGMLHFLGLGVPRDELEASIWIRESAEQGYEYAQYFLGNAYANGWNDVIQQDKTEAKKWMLKAAAQGNLDAQRYLKKTLKKQ